MVASLRVSAMKTYVAFAINDYYFISNGVDRLVQRGGELVIVWLNLFQCMERSL